MNRRSTYRPRNIRKGDPLSAREVQILALVAVGESTPAISRRLGLAENTVKSHLTAVYKKIGSSNRVHAARHYLDHYVATPGDHSGAGPPAGPTASALIREQMGQLQARLEQLTPAAVEAERLRHALEALRAIELD